MYESSHIAWQIAPGDGMSSQFVTYCEQNDLPENEGRTECVKASRTTQGQIIPALNPRPYGQFGRCVVRCEQNASRALSGRTLRQVQRLIKVPGHRFVFREKRGNEHRLSGPRRNSFLFLLSQRRRTTGSHVPQQPGIAFNVGEPTSVALIAHAPYA